MKSFKWLLLCAPLCAGSARAADLTLTADWWDYAVSGSVNRAGDLQDLRYGLGVQAQSHAAFSLAWNTGPGWWKPDLAASYTPLHAGGEQVTQATRFGPVTLIPGTVASGQAGVDDYDVTLRYPVALGPMQVWGGATIKRLAGPVTVSSASSARQDVQDIDETFPMLHLAASVPLSDWLSLSAQANGVKYQDNNAWELRAGASIGIAGPVGLNVGWQCKHYRVNEGDYLLETRLSGLLAGVFVTLR